MTVYIVRYLKKEHGQEAKEDKTISENLSFDRGRLFQLRRFLEMLGQRNILEEIEQQATKDLVQRVIHPVEFTFGTEDNPKKHVSFEPVSKSIPLEKIHEITEEDIRELLRDYSSILYEWKKLFPSSRDLENPKRPKTKDEEKAQEEFSTAEGRRIEIEEILAFLGQRNVAAEVEKSMQDSWNEEQDYAYSLSTYAFAKSIEWPAAEIIKLSKKKNPAIDKERCLVFTTLFLYMAQAAKDALQKETKSEKLHELEKYLEKTATYYMETINNIKKNIPEKKKQFEIDNLRDELMKLLV